MAIVISTLLIYALFWPLRARVQNLIDRRFYRGRYDSTKIVEAFSATLRNDADLNELCDQLLAVVQETMQPANISLWLVRDTGTRSQSVNEPQAGSGTGYLAYLRVGGSGALREFLLRADTNRMYQPWLY